MNKLLIILILLCAVCVTCGAQAGKDTSFFTKNGDHVIIQQGDTTIVFNGEWKEGTDPNKSTPLNRKSKTYNKTDLYWDKYVKRQRNTLFLNKPRRGKKTD